MCSTNTITFVLEIILKNLFNCLSENIRKKFEATVSIANHHCSIGDNDK